MSYSVAAPPKLLVKGVGTAPSLWLYTTTDAHTDVDAVGYFTDGASLGLRINDVMIVVDTDSATCTIHSVLSTVSINPATLA